MSLVPRDTFLPPEAAAEQSAPFTPSHVGIGLRAEDAARLVVGGLLVLLAGLGLGSFTFHEIAGRGTGYLCCPSAPRRRHAPEDIGSHGPGCAGRSDTQRRRRN